jgi:hypothetical protein
MPLSWPDKDPQEVLDYALDWTARLAGDTIATSSWVLPTGITKASDSHDVSTTKIWLSGGVEGTKYTLVNTITTTAGRTMNQSVAIKVKAK